MNGLQALTREKLSPQLFSKLMMEPVFSIPAHLLSNLAQTYVKNASFINLSLTKIAAIIERLDHVDYDQLTDAQKNRLVSYAKEVDGLNDFIRGEIYQKLTELHNELHEKVAQQIQANQQFIVSLGSYLDQLMAHVREQTGLDIQWTQGKSILLWDEIEGWLSRYSGVDREDVMSLRNKNVEPYEELEQFLKTIVYSEALIASVDHPDNEAKGMFSSTVSERAKKACLKFKFELPKCAEIQEMKEDLYEHMTELSEKVRMLEEEVHLMPVFEDKLAEDEQKQFAKTVNRHIEYSPVFDDDLNNLEG
jgi:hypothetical protein